MQAVNKVVYGQVRNRKHAEDIAMSACARVDAWLLHRSNYLAKKLKLKRVRIRVIVEDADA